MDPKMDSGYVPENDSFEADFDPAAPLTFEQTLWILDQLFSLEIAWHDCYPLSQTLFTSLHVFRLLDPRQPNASSFDYPGAENDDWAFRNPEQIFAQGLLTAYCFAVIKCCATSIELVQSQNYYEEEDLVTHTFGRDLLPRLSHEDVFGMLEDVSRKVAKSSSLSEELREALRDRLQFRMEFLHGLRGGEVNYTDLTTLVVGIRHSHGLATPVPEAFSDKVQRQLATSTPPRPMLNISLGEACEKWTQMCGDIGAAHRLTESRIVASPANLHRAIWTFAYRSEPFALPRAVLQNVLFGGEAINGEIPHYEWLLHDISELTLGGHPMIDPTSFQVEVTTDWRHKSSRLIEGFMDKAIEEYLNLYRMVCQNRCRIRRTFTQAIPILDAMETEAADTDAQIAKVVPNLTMQYQGKTQHLNPLSSWSKFYKLRVMAWTVQLGFETDIYLDDELPGMYYFLSWLYQHQDDLILHLLRFTRERGIPLAARHGTPGLAGNWLSEEYLASLHCLAEVWQRLAEALWKVFTILTHVGVVAAPRRDFAVHQLLFDVRMKPFLAVTRDPIPRVGQFLAATQLDKPVEQVCEDVEKIVKDPRLTTLLSDARCTHPENGKFAGLEEQWDSEIKGLKATSVAIAVAVSQIKRVCGEHGEEKVKERLECRVERKYALWWAVPVLKQIVILDKKESA